MSSLNDTSPEKSIWGYKGLIFGVLFFGLFLLGLIKALSSEPDYMPSQQVKRKQEALAQQQAQVATTETAEQKPAEVPVAEADNKTTDAKTDVKAEVKENAEAKADTTADAKENTEAKQ